MSDLRSVSCIAEAAVAVAELECAAIPDERVARGSATVSIDDPLAVAVLSAVRHATRGGVRDLEVRLCDGALCLRGRCSTYYCKQLAQQAVKDLACGARLYNEIEVW